MEHFRQAVEKLEGETSLGRAFLASRETSSVGGKSRLPKGWSPTQALPRVISQEKVWERLAGFQPWVAKKIPVVLNALGFSNY